MERRGTKRIYFSSESYQTQPDPELEIVQPDAPEEVISAVNVVVAEETFTVKCFLTMMAPGSKIKSLCTSNVNVLFTSHIPRATCDRVQLKGTCSFKCSIKL